MLSKKRLLTLAELNLKDKIEQMDEAQLNIYAQKMNLFIDSYPAYERNVKDALAGHDSGMISMNLMGIRMMLTDLHSDRLANKSNELINTINGITADKLEANLTAFFSEVSALSIAMQMVQQIDEKPDIVDEVTEKQEYYILAVDDASFFLSALKAFLDGTKYKVTCLTSGATALRYLLKNTPDLFLLDIEMPEMDGYELAQKIKTQGFTAPIIFLTGNASKEYVAKAIKAGGVDFIVKPIDKIRVMEKLEKHL
ncbi:MAG: response regulator [Lachnospiraceae bacterium]|nr:response regulator [Lachnospiraceae bacterium]